MVSVYQYVNYQVSVIDAQVYLGSKRRIQELDKYECSGQR